MVFRSSRWVSGRLLSPLAMATITLTLYQVSAAQEVPRAEAILDKFVEATGGKAAYEKIKTRISSGTMEVVAAGVKGKMTITQKAPDQGVMKLEMPQLGSTQQGASGSMAWEVNPVTGARVLEGDEKASAIRSSSLESDYNWQKFFTKAESKGVEDVEGKPAYKVVLTPKEGNPTTNFYDKASGLLVRSDTTIKGPMGEMPISAIVSDYKDFDGVKLPLKVKQKILSQEILITLDKIEQNVELPAGTFDLPAEIKALTEKKS